MKYFQSPCRRGNGCILRRTCWRCRSTPLSVPLSSGQWLHPVLLLAKGMVRISFSPLVVGAMAASHFRGVKGLCLSRPFSPLVVGAMAASAYLAFLLPLHSPTFSPLVVGAMAASTSPKTKSSCSPPLSVPLSSGQWLHRRWVVSLGKNLGPFSPLVVGAMAASLS